MQRGLCFAFFVAYVTINQRGMTGNAVLNALTPPECSAVFDDFRVLRKMGQVIIYENGKRIPPLQIFNFKLFSMSLQIHGIYSIISKNFDLQTGVAI